ncbi:MAG: alpha/beta fold hydrolase [Vicingus serpentipes]|nr:alpha/beta fold hydrolase [Vicingus serpentipes]
MKLNYKHLGSGQPLIILHGLFGSLDNWMTLAKKLSTSYEVFIVDARNHGQSPKSDIFNYDVMADDLYAFLLEHQIVDPVILGHSMGGKTAMQFAMNYPNKIDKLVVVDIAPKSYPVHHKEIIDGMLSLNFDNIKTRNEADEQLSQYIPEPAVRQFLLKNLYWSTKNKLDWRFNLSVINQNINEVGKELSNITPFNKPTLFVRGEKSNYITAEDYDNILNLFPKAAIKSLNCGHWIHAEKPLEFEQLLVTFLGSSVQNSSK